MQLIFEKGYEFEACDGLGLIPGTVEKIPANGLIISNSRVVIRRSSSHARAKATKSGKIWAAAGHTTIQKRQIVAKTALFIKSSGFYLIISEHKKTP